MAPEYLKLKNEIRKEILTGKYPAGKRIPSRNEYMRQYQLARGTVDKAINQLIEEGVLAGQQGSGTYAADITGKNSKKTVLYIVLHKETDIKNTELYPWLSYIQQNLEKKYRLKIIPIYDILIKTERYLDDAVGFIFCLLNPAYLEIVQNLQRWKCPLLLLNRHDKEYDYISTDVFQGLSGTFKKLKTQKVAIVTEEASLRRPYRNDYNTGFYRAAAVNELQIQADWHIICELTNPEGGIRKLLKILAKKNRPDTLFLSGFAIPYVISAIIASNLKIGKDIKLINFGENKVISGMEGVISLQHDFITMGRMSLDWLEQITGEKKKPFQILVPPRGNNKKEPQNDF